MNYRNHYLVALKGGEDNASGPNKVSEETMSQGILMGEGYTCSLLAITGIRITSAYVN